MSAPRHGAALWQRQAKTSLEREVVTPEGVTLRFVLASAGDRAAACLIDLLFQIVAVVVVGLLVGVAVGGQGRSFLVAVYVLLAFLVQSFYFPFFELRWRGATPGKRRLGLRVIDARGGQLEISSVLARNLVRELEVWMPARFLLAGAGLWPGAPGWAKLLAGVWLLVLALLPLFNKDRLRLGDLLGGTRVVVEPALVLAPDLADERASAAAVTAQHSFTPEQLAVYGVYELQVLEDVLRRDPSSPAFSIAVATVREKIAAKLDYRLPIHDSERFLRDFYAALRAHLEQRILFGQRRADKYAPQ